MLKHRRKIVGGWVTGLAAGLILSQYLFGTLNIEPTATINSILGVLGIVGVLISTRGRLTWGPGEEV